MGIFSPNTYFSLSGFPFQDIFENCDTVWKVLENIKPYLASRILGSIDSKKHALAYFINPESISVGEGTIIEPGVCIKGPCIIGRNCYIRHGVYIRGDVIIGDNCVVGHATELKHSILLNHAHAAHFAYIGDSIIGNANLGSHVTCANLRLKGDEVVIKYNNESFNTGVRKLGAIVGDFCQIGCNVVLNPGTILGKGVHVHPCLNVSGVIAEKHTVKNKVSLEISPYVIQE